MTSSSRLWMLDIYYTYSSTAITRTCYSVLQYLIPKYAAFAIWST